MALPTIHDVRPVDPVLTEMSVAFRNKDYLWEKLAPISRVSQQTGTYFIYTRDYWFRALAGLEHAAGTPYLKTGYGVSTGTYAALEYGAEKVLADSIRAASQTPEDLANVDLAFLVNQMELNLEKAVAAAAFVTGVWGTSTTLAGTDQWSDFDASDPIAKADTAIRTIRRATGAVPNTLFLGALTWEKLKEHPLILEKYKYVQKGVMTPDLVAPIMGVEEIVVGTAVENTENEGGTYTAADIWTDSALFLVRNPPGLSTPVGATTFMWDWDGSVPWGVDRYTDDAIKAEVQRIRSFYAVKIVSAQHGYLYLDCVA